LSDIYLDKSNLERLKVISDAIDRAYLQLGINNNLNKNTPQILNGETNSTMTHQFDTLGVSTVKCIATDPSGLSASSSALVTVKLQNKKPYFNDKTLSFTVDSNTTFTYALNKACEEGKSVSMTVMRGKKLKKVIVNLE
jgi:hypothetical protein